MFDVASLFTETIYKEIMLISSSKAFGLVRQKWNEFACTEHKLLTHVYERYC
jgi:hypothetical protein